MDNDLKDLIERYKNEMLKYNTNINKTERIPKSSVENLPKDEDAFDSDNFYNDEFNDIDNVQDDERFESDNHFNDEFDDSNIKYDGYMQSDRANEVLTQVANDEYAPAFGKLIVSVTTAKVAVPLKDALVTVTEKTETGAEKLLYTVMTNEDGETPELELKTLPLELSQNVNYMGKPYKSYNIRTSLDGYFTVLNIGVPIFATQRSYQPVNMIPLPENYKGNKTIEFSEPEQLENGINAGGNDTDKTMEKER